MTMITPSYLGETIEYSSLHACRSTLEDPTVLQTVRGSVDFASQSRGHLADLRNQVTSPGGTSAEALYQMEKGALRTIVSKAVHAAYQRSRALSRLSEPPAAG